jgi:hypothetical protein
MAGAERHVGPNDEFHRRFISPEERKERRLSPWRGDFRWFESANVLALEQYRSKDQWAQIRARFWPMQRTALKFW